MRDTAWRGPVVRCAGGPDRCRRSGGARPRRVGFGGLGHVLFTQTCRMRADDFPEILLRDRRGAGLDDGSLLDGQPVQLKADGTCQALVTQCGEGGRRGSRTGRRVVRLEQRTPGGRLREPQQQAGRRGQCRSWNPQQPLTFPRPCVEALRSVCHGGRAPGDRVDARRRGGNRAWLQGLHPGCQGPEGHADDDAVPDVAGSAPAKCLGHGSNTLLRRVGGPERETQDEAAFATKSVGDDAHGEVRSELDRLDASHSGAVRCSVQQFEEGRSVGFPQRRRVRIQTPEARAQGKSQAQQQQTYHWLKKCAKTENGQPQADDDQPGCEELHRPCNAVRGYRRAPGTFRVHCSTVMGGFHRPPGGERSIPLERASISSALRRRDKRSEHVLKARLTTSGSRFGSAAGHNGPMSRRTARPRRLSAAPVSQVTATSPCPAGCPPPTASAAGGFTPGPRHRHARR